MQPARQRRQRRPAGLLEPWFAPFALVNGAAVGITPILLPVVAARHGLGHVGIVMGAFNLGAFAAPLIGSLADQRHAYRALATACAAVTAVSLWLFPLAGNALQVLLALGDGAGFAGAVTIANLLVVERHPRAEWNQRLGWLETALSVGQGGALFLSAWLSGLSPKDGLLIGALVPAAAIPLALLLIPRMPAGRAAPPEPASPGPGHHLASIGHVGEWGPASPSRVHRAWMWPRRRLTGVTGLLRGGLGWMLAAWLPAYAGSAIIFSLYPVLFRQAFGIATATSALAFAVIVFVSLPLFVLAGRASQRFGPAPSSRPPTSGASSCSPRWPRSPPPGTSRRCCRWPPSPASCSRGHSSASPRRGWPGSSGPTPKVTLRACSTRAAAWPACSARSPAAWPPTCGATRPRWPSAPGPPRPAWPSSRSRCCAGDRPPPQCPARHHTGPPDRAGARTSLLLAP